jgi:hypothetical protein
MSKIEVDQIVPQSGTNLTVGESGDTITVPSGATFDASNATTSLPANVVTTDGTQTLTNKTIDASQLVDASVSNAKLTNSSITLNGNSVSLGGSASIASGMFRNIIINGDMSIAQRGTSFASASGYTLDRFSFDKSNDGAVTITQDTDVPSGQGFAKSLKVDVTTADTSIGASQFAILSQRIEAQNLQYLKYGTANAETLTLSFWVKSNKTGTYCISLIKIDNTRYDYIAEYSISSADTWEKKTITIAPDSNIQAAGGAIDNDNGIGFYCQFTLANGSGRQGSNETWNTSTPATSTSNQVNFLDSTANEFYITGVQLEAGTTASDFEFLPFDVNTDRCQRYYQKSYNYSDAPGTATSDGMTNPAGNTASGTSTGQCINTTALLKEMRAAPTIVNYDAAGTSGKVYGIRYGVNEYNGEDAASFRVGSKYFSMQRASGTSIITFSFHYTASAEL